MQESKMKELVREMEVVVLRRLDQVERENRRLKRTSGVLLAGLALLLGLAGALLVVFARQGGTVSEVVQARRFVLRDDEGLIRGTFGMEADGSVRLVLQDRDGRGRLRFSLPPDGSSGISINDRDGNARAVLGFLADQTATLVFTDGAGNTRAVLGVSADQSSSLVLADPDGAPRTGLTVDASGFPRFFESETVSGAPGDSAGRGSPGRGAAGN